MDSELEKIIKTSNQKRKVFRRRFFKFIFVTIGFGFLYLLYVGLFALKLTFYQNTLISIVFFFIAGIIIFRLFSELGESQRDQSEIIGASLIRLSRYLTKYLADPMNTKELILANNQLNSAINSIGLTFSSQKEFYAFDTSNRVFLTKLKKYLKFEVLRSLSIDADKETQERIKYELEHLGRTIYSKDFKSAEKYLDAHKKKGYSKKFFSEKVTNFLYNTDYISTIFSLILIITSFLYILKKYSLLDSLEGLNILINLMALFIAYSVFGPIKKMIRWGLDAIFTLTFEIKNKEDSSET